MGCQCRAHFAVSDALVAVGHWREAVVLGSGNQHDYDNLDDDHDHQQCEELAFSDIDPAKHGSAWRFIALSSYDVYSCRRNSVDNVRDTCARMMTSFWVCITSYELDVIRLECFPNGGDSPRRVTDSRYCTHRLTAWTSQQNNDITCILFST